MATKLKEGGYACSYCNKKFDRHQEADACRDSHNLIYVQMSRADLDKLLMFIRLKEDGLITETLWRSLTKIRRRY